MVSTWSQPRLTITALMAVFVLCIAMIALVADEPAQARGGGGFGGGGFSRGGDFGGMSQSRTNLSGGDFDRGSYGNGYGRGPYDPGYRDMDPDYSFNGDGWGYGWGGDGFGAALDGDALAGEATGCQPYYYGAQLLCY